MQKKYLLQVFFHAFRVHANHLARDRLERLLSIRSRFPADFFV